MTLALEVLATGTLWLALLLPLVLAALWQRRVLPDRRLALLAALVFLDLAVEFAPHARPFPGSGWNWQGKLLELAWVLAFAVLSGRGFARLGVRTPLAPGSLRALLLAALVALALPMALWAQGQRMPVDAETLLYQLTMPGLAEELVFRGVFQSVLNDVFGRPWTMARAAFGWGAILSTALFVLGHGVVFDRDLHLELSVLGPAFALVPGIALAWLRERTGSVWPCVVLHNLVDGLPLIATALTL